MKIYLTINCENKNLHFAVFRLTLTYFDDSSSTLCWTPVSAMVSIKISRRKFSRPGPGTSALRMLERLTGVKHECDAYLYVCKHYDFRFFSSVFILGYVTLQ